MNHTDRLRAAKGLRRAVISAVVAELPPASQAEIGAAVAASLGLAEPINSATIHAALRRDMSDPEAHPQARRPRGGQSRTRVMAEDLDAALVALLPPGLGAEEVQSVADIAARAVRTRLVSLRALRG